MPTKITFSHDMSIGITINKFRTTKYYFCSVPLLPYHFISKGGKQACCCRVGHTACILRRKSIPLFINNLIFIGHTARILRNYLIFACKFSIHFNRLAYSILPLSYTLFTVMFIVWRPSAALLTAVTPIVRRSPYTLLTAVEQQTFHHNPSTFTS